MIKIEIEEKLLNFINDAGLTFSCNKNILTINFPDVDSLTVISQVNALVFTWEDFIEGLQEEYSPNDLQRLLDSYAYYRNTVKPFLDYGIIKPVEVIKYEFA